MGSVSPIRRNPVLRSWLERREEVQRTAQCLNWAMLCGALGLALFLDVWSSSPCGCVLAARVQRMYVALWEERLAIGLLLIGIFQIWLYAKPRLFPLKVILTNEARELLGLSKDEPGFTVISPRVTPPMKADGQIKQASPLIDSYRSLRRSPSPPLSPFLSSSPASYLHSPMSPSTSPAASGAMPLSPSARFDSFTGSPSGQHISPTPNGHRLRNRSLMGETPSPLSKSSDGSFDGPIISSDQLERFLQQSRQQAGSRLNASPQHTGGSPSVQYQHSPCGAPNSFVDPSIASLRNYTYQIAPYVSSPEERPSHDSGSGSVGGRDERARSAFRDDVWDRIGIPHHHLARWTENLRDWITQTLFMPLVREINAANQALGKEGQLGSLSLADLKGLSLAKGLDVGALPRLIAYLECHPNQEYVIQRIKELARGGCLREYRWDKGSHAWNDQLPTDAAIVMHMISSYFDAHMPPDPTMPGAVPFTGRHYLPYKRKSVTSPPPSAVVPSPRRPLSSGSVSHSQPYPQNHTYLAIVQESLNPPHFKLHLPNGEMLTAKKGRNNLFHTILMFLHHIQKEGDGMLGRVNLGLSGINILWVLKS
ncbi:unnamed protein product [Cyprideis torosa]|uniref:Uncharacterized protein n=1 Tax=Cyprideis torosa TaxID=163714 RepID=A0A7R8W089_9CRUS|nr:unnamed protein product [Cyprideis torosa]CAG0879495.1 unnamed protein product [Cyprideis torosa]